MWEKPDLSLSRVVCPVCKALLGRRNKGDSFHGHCSECRATFYWKPKSEKPSVIMDKNVPARCNCGGCGR